MPYDDSTGKALYAKGKITIWWGLNLTDLDTPTMMELAEFALTRQIQQKVNGLRALVGGFDSLPDDIQRVLVDLAYNVGLGGIAGFKKMLIAISQRDYLTASVEILDCKAYKTAVEKKLTGLRARYEELSSLLKGVS